MPRPKLPLLPPKKPPLPPQLPPQGIKSLKKKNDNRVSFEEQVYAGLKPFLHLPPESKLVALALSGGGDSTAMTAALAALTDILPFKLHAVHINHGIRSTQSCAADEQSAARLCAKLDIPFTPITITPGTIETHARRFGTGIEAAAREYRYRLLSEQASKLGASAIFTAHTASDRLETILMAFLRGAGPAGLGALSDSVTSYHCQGSNQDLLIARPLLGLDRSAVLSYLKERNLDYCIDETNTDERFIRNRVRQKLIPLLDESFPGWREPVLRLGETQAMTARFLQEEADRRIPWQAISSKTVNDEPRRRAAGYRRSVRNGFYAGLIPGISSNNLEDTPQRGGVLNPLANNMDKYYSGLSVCAETFFAQPDILKEQALFNAIDRLAQERQDGQAYPCPRRETLRTFIRDDEPRRRAAGYRRSVRNGFYAGLIPGISSNNLEDTPQRGWVLNPLANKKKSVDLGFCRIEYNASIAADNADKGCIIIQKYQKTVQERGESVLIKSIDNNKLLVLRSGNKGIIMEERQPLHGKLSVSGSK